MGLYFDKQSGRKDGGGGRKATWLSRPGQLPPSLVLLPLLGISFGFLLCLRGRVGTGSRPTESPEWLFPAASWSEVHSVWSKSEEICRADERQVDPPTSPCGQSRPFLRFSVHTVCPSIAEHIGQAQPAVTGVTTRLLARRLHQEFPNGREITVWDANESN